MEEYDSPLLENSRTSGLRSPGGNLQVNIYVGVVNLLTEKCTRETLIVARVVESAFQRQDHSATNVVIGPTPSINLISIIILCS